MPIFRYFATNLSTSTHVLLFLSSFKSATSSFLTSVLWLLSQPLVQLRFQESYLLRFHVAIESLTPVVSLLEETVYPIVRLPSRYTSRPFPVFPGRSRPSIGVPVAFSNDSRTRLNCFPIRHLLNIRPCWIKRECVIFQSFANFLYLYLMLCFYNSMLAFFNFVNE